MTPDNWLILACSALTAISYGLWVMERLPRIRTALAVLAFVSFLAAVVVYDLDVPNPLS